MVEDAPEAVKERDVNGELPIHLSLSYKLFTSADVGKTVVIKEDTITVDGCVHNVEWCDNRNAHEDANAKRRADRIAEAQGGGAAEEESEEEDFDALVEGV